MSILTPNIRGKFAACALTMSIEAFDFERNESKIDQHAFRFLGEHGTGYLWGQVSGLAGGIAILSEGYAAERAFNHDDWATAAIAGIGGIFFAAASAHTLRRGCRSSKIMTLTTMPRRLFKTVGYGAILGGVIWSTQKSDERKETKEITPVTVQTEHLQHLPN